MSVLVYIGIRILISSTSEQKAKYKQLLGDWVVGMVLLFTMHYIMSFSNIAVDHLTELFSSINPMGQTALIPDNNDKVESELKEYEIEVVKEKTEVTDTNNKKVFKYEETGGDKFIEWNTDLMGRLRIDLQAYKKDKEEYIGYTILYIVMVIYTGIFIYTYIKRVIYMAFLTIISPLVALTYPIDKANDGSAQGFNYWFKEYIFNLLLQPLHLLMYTILVSTAIKLATENMIYSLVAIGFIASAEKILRQMFNFSKASTPGVFAGPAGAAITMTGMRWLFGHGPRGGRNAQAKGGAVKGSEGQDNAGIISSGKEKLDIAKVFGSGDDSSNKKKKEQGRNQGVKQSFWSEDQADIIESIPDGLSPEQEADILRSQGLTDVDIAQLHEDTALDNPSYFSDETDNWYTEGMDYSNEEKAEIFRNLGYDDVSISEKLKENRRFYACSKRNSWSIWGRN